MGRRPSDTVFVCLPRDLSAAPQRRLAHIVASFISLAPPCSAGLAHSAAPPLPTKPTSLGFRGDLIIARSYLFR